MPSGVERWVRSLLWAFPPAFRAKRGRELLEFMDEAWGAAPSAVARCRVLIAGSWDLIRSGTRLRWAERTRRRGRRSRPRREGMMGAGTLETLHEAARGLLRSPGFSLLVVGTLAAAIGLNTALFSVVDRVLLRPLDYPESARLLYVNQARLALDEEQTLISGGLLSRLRDAEVFEAVEGIARVRQNLTGAGLPRQVEVGWVSPGFLPLLGARPVAGRLPSLEDPEGVVVLSHGLWQDQFGGDPGAVGGTVELDGNPHTVIGVVGPAFELRLPGTRNDQPELWRGPDSRWANGDVWNELGAEFGLLRVLARRTPDASPERIDEALTGIVERVAELDPAYREAEVRLTAAPLKERVVEGLDRTLLLLFGSVLAVLLVACLNAANLMLVRAHAREREFALRLSLGASRQSVAVFHLAESLVLAGLAAVLGSGLAAGLAWAAPRVAPAGLLPTGSFTLDARMLGFSLACVGVASLSTAALPALRGSRLTPGLGLTGGRGTTSGASRLRGSLVVLQLGCSLILLTGAGLLSHSLVRMQATEPGFEATDRLTFSVSIPGARYEWPGPGADEFYRRVEAGTEALPGVDQAGVVWPLPFSGSGWSGDARLPDADGGARRTAGYVLATEGFFGVMGVPLRAGRLYREGDGRHVVVVNEALAAQHWPGQEAVGRRLELDPWGGGLEAFEVVGVVGDVRMRDLREPAGPTAYFDTRGWSWVDWKVDVVARTSGEPGAVVPSIREMVAELDPEVPVAEVSTLEAYLARESRGLRFALLLVGLFGAVALLLAGVGLYGTLAYTVGLQHREIGIRMALGSRRREVTALVLGRGARLLAAGVALGLVGSFLLSGLLESYLFDVRPSDPLTLAAVTATLAVVGLLASWVPAVRASRLDPVVTLRGE